MTDHDDIPPIWVKVYFMDGPAVARNVHLPVELRTGERLIVPVPDGIRAVYVAHAPAVPVDGNPLRLTQAFKFVPG